MENVLVTGADRGLGLGICKAFLENGFQVFAGQFMPAWLELSEMKTQYPENLHLIPLDVSSMQSVKNAAEMIGRIAGTLDIVVNNAGIGGRMGTIDDEVYYEKAKNIFSVNSLGPLRVVESCLPLMKKGKKRICFISSEAGSVSVCSRTEGYSYTMSKTALNMGIRHMHNQLQADGYSFRLYHPGWVQSYMSGKKNTEAMVPAEDSGRVAVRQFLEASANEKGLRLKDFYEQVWPM